MFKDFKISYGLKKANGKASNRRYVNKEVPDSFPVIILPDGDPDKEVREYLLRCIEDMEELHGVLKGKLDKEEIKSDVDEHNIGIGKRFTDLMDNIKYVETYKDYRIFTYNDKRDGILCMFTPEHYTLHIAWDEHPYKDFDHFVEYFKDYIDDALSE